MSTESSHPRLAGVYEVTALAQISKARLNELVDQGTCPAPYQTLRLGRVWLLEDIEAWVARRRTRPGRPPGSRVTRTSKANG